MRYTMWQFFLGRRRRAQPSASPIKHPVRSDFHTVLTKTGVSVTFKPTNSTYSFHRRADTNVTAHLGPASFVGVNHAGRDTEDYPPEEVRNLAQQIASEHDPVYFVELQDAKEVK
jgi:hypothetical protein